MDIEREIMPLSEIQRIIEEQLAILLDGSKHCEFAEQLAPINQAICASVQTLFFLKNQCGAGEPVELLSSQTSKEN